MSFERLRAAAQAPADWLTYSGSYFSQRYSELDQVTSANVRDLQLQWVYQTPVLGPWQSTPLVADGVMYLTQRPNDVVALDARTGRVFWVYSYATPPDHRACCGSNNRGVAILGNRVFMATLDAHVVALDAATGAELWNVELADRHLAYSFTLAPLVVKDMVIIGSAGGDRGVRGFIAALDAATGEEVWRFHTIPGPGEPGHETWEACPPDPETYCDPEAWMHGGGRGVADRVVRPGAEPDVLGPGKSGAGLQPRAAARRQPVLGFGDRARRRHRRVAGYFQFTPNDPYDYDSVQIPVLADIERNGFELKAMLVGQPQRLLLRAGPGRPARFLTGQPFVTVNWAEGLDDNGRPVETPQPPGAPTYPGVQGGTNWYSPSFSPSTELFYVSAWESYASVFDAQPQEYEPGRSFIGGRPTTFEPVPDAPTVPGLTRGPINAWTDAAGSGAVVALDALTGEPRWKFEMTDVTSSGILTTASDLLFSGARSGYFQALDARSGDLLWRVSLGGQIVNGPMTYAVDGRQYLAVIAGSSLSTFALRD